MIEQQGQVVAVNDGCVSVRLGGTSGCSACDAGKGCGAGVFGRLLQRKPVVLEFDNALQARTGQAVMVGLPESLYLKLVSRFYLYPLLAGMAGAAAGHAAASGFQWTTWGVDVFALASGLAAAYATVRVLRHKAKEFPGQAAVHLLRIIETTSCNKEQEVYT